MIDVHSPREREMLAGLARTSALARPDRSKQITGTRSRRSKRTPVRKLVELFARYIVFSYVRNVVTTMRNLYWVREMEAPGDSRELKLLCSRGRSACLVRHRGAC